MPSISPKMRKRAASTRCVRVRPATSIRLVAAPTASSNAAATSGPGATPTSIREPPNASDAVRIGKAKRERDHAGNGCERTDQCTASETRIQPPHSRLTDIQDDDGQHHKQHIQSAFLKRRSSQDGDDG